MNYLQFGTFILFVICALAAGIRIHLFLNKDRAPLLNRGVYLGETLLLGSSWIIGGMMFLGFGHLYRAGALWGLVAANLLFLVDKKVRTAICEIIFRKVKFDLPLAAFFLFLAFFIFRNCYYLFDIDSVMGYAFAQRFWLEAGTNLVGTDADYWPTFLPMYDSVPYALGLSLFGDDMLFGGLVTLYWRLIVIFLVFGYTSHRFNRWYGLAAVFLMMLDDHMFYSGINAWVIINSAVVALSFAAAYNLWEARQQSSSFRFLLGFIFLSQLVANKYQSFWIVLFFSVVGLGLQPHPCGMVKAVLKDKRWMFALGVAVLLSSTWYIKNLILTGTPIFFKFAGAVKALGWTPEQEKVFLTLLGGLSFSKALKYLSFNFIWAGVYALKYIWTILSFLPIIFIVLLVKDKWDRKALLEFSFWLAASLLALLGVTLAAYYDPRYYRFPLGIFAFTAIVSIHFILTNCFALKKQWMLTAILLVIAIPGYKVAFEQGGPFRRPTFRENLNVLMNKMTGQQAISKYYPEVRQIKQLLSQNPDKIHSMAYYIQDDMNFPLIYLPIKPIVSVWRSSLVKWDSFASEELIMKDLRGHGVEWVLMERPSPEDPVILPIDAFAKIFIKVNRYPKTIFNVGDYGFPKELIEVKY